MMSNLRSNSHWKEHWIQRAVVASSLINAGGEGGGGGGGERCILESNASFTLDRSSIARMVKNAFLYVPNVPPS